LAHVVRARDLVLSIAGVVALFAGCQEPLPGKPTYTTDIKPLFDANCVRCHGAGGTENSDPRTGSAYMNDMPVSHLNQYASTGGCDPDAGAAQAPCVLGAQWAASLPLLHAYIHGTGVQMPLPPAEPLSDWELSLIDRWLANGYPE
jgi:mono/diheme cytochrome c family protein